jgi:hypothetical protein
MIRNDHDVHGRAVLGRDGVEARERRVRVVFEDQ